MIDVNVEVAGDGVTEVLGVLLHWLDGTAPEGNWQRLDPRSLVTNAAVANPGQILFHTLHHRGGARLLFDAGFVVALVEDQFFEETVGTGRAVTAVDADRFVFPFAAQSQIAPFGNILPPALARTRENGVGLLHGERFDGIVLVHVDRQGIESHGDQTGLVTIFLFEGVDFLRLHLAAHRTELGGAGNQGRRGGGGTFAFDLNFHVGIMLGEGFGPERHQVVQRIRADGIEISRDPADGFVIFQVWIERHDILGQDGCMQQAAAQERGGSETGKRFGSIIFHTISLG